jgi:hypothetical protein
MALFNPTDLIESAIVRALASEMNLTGTNPSGRLQTVKSIGKCRINEGVPALYPYIGVEDYTERESPDSTAAREVETIWRVDIQTRSTVSLTDAKAQLRPILEDGAGNGVRPILRDPANFSLGNLLRSSEVIQTDRTDDLEKDPSGSTAAFFAGATVYVKTRAYVTINGRVQ